MKLQDRTTGDVFELKIDDGQFYIEVVAETADAEPIFEDALNSGTYWTLFIDGGMISWEETATVQDDAVEIVDDTTGVIWSLGIYDEQFRYVQTGVTGEIHGHSLSHASFLYQELEVGI